MKRFNPYTLILLWFLIFLSIGASLLCLPVFHKIPTSSIDAIFVATSAFTVTGLSTVDITQYFNIGGIVVIMLLIQCGGLGVITLGMIVFMMMGKKVGIKQRYLLTEALNQNNLGGIIRLVRKVFILSLTIEVIGALCLSLEWIPEMGLWKGLGHSFFTSISAFNNAGFALQSDNLVRYQTNPMINLFVTTLIILGSIGITVLLDLIHTKDIKRLKLHTKLMIGGTLVLNTVATITIFILESHNTRTLGGHTFFEQLQMAYFQVVTTRTAGFNTIDIGSMNRDSLLVMMMLMFIGGGSTSAAGGIKLTTAIVILFGTVSFIRQESHIRIARKTIDVKILFRSLTIVVLSSSVVFFSVFTMLLIEKDLSFEAILFEVVSALATTGLSVGITSQLSVLGKMLIISLMIIGKVGVLTIVYTVARRKKSLFYYPKEDVLTG